MIFLMNIDTYFSKKDFSIEQKTYNFSFCHTDACPGSSNKTQQNHT